MSKTYLVEANKKLEAEKGRIELEKQRIESDKQRVESELLYTKYQLDQLRRLIFGYKRERFNPNLAHGQMVLPFGVPEFVDQKPEETEKITYSRRKKNRNNHPGRLPLPDHLPVEEIILEPNEDTSNLKYIGKEITDQLELIPAKLFIKRFIRHKYVKTEDKDQQTFKGVIAPLPVFPIEKGT